MELILNKEEYLQDIFNKYTVTDNYLRDRDYFTISNGNGSISVRVTNEGLIILSEVSVGEDHDNVISILKEYAKIGFQAEDSLYIYDDNPIDKKGLERIIYHSGLSLSQNTLI